MNLKHEFEPIFNKESKILILGTFPSVKSREEGFYYGHPRNRFWVVLSNLMKTEVAVSKEEKIAFLLKHQIAVWDVIQSCDIEGSSDSSIKEVIPTDINFVLNQSDIRNIYANGSKAFDLYMRYTYQTTKQPITKLPSTSPTNAAYSLDKLLESWKNIIDSIETI